VSALILINGEEEFLMEQAASDEAAASLAESIQIYKDPENLSSYLEESQIIPISGEARAFIIWNPGEVPLLPVGEQDVLIIVTNFKKKLEDARAKRVHNFSKFKAYDDKNDVINWILREGERRNRDLNQIASMLFVNSGKSLRKIFSEINKLSVMTPPGGVVTPEIARSVICFSAELTPRNIIDSICNGQTSRAIAYYDKLQEGGDETGWIIAYVHRHVLQQLRLEHLNKSDLESRGAEILDIHPFLYKKMRESRIGIWSNASLLSSVATLAELDIAHKKGNILARFGLELEIIRLSEEAKRNVKRNRH
jgi:DNA polymerase III delta subunit